MTDEEAMAILHTAAKKRESCGMTEEDAVKELDELIDLPGLTHKQMIALGMAAGVLEKPARSRWVKPENRIPETNTPILMAVRSEKRYHYYAGRYYMAGKWVLETDLQDDFFSQLYSKPDYWCYIDELEAAI